MRTWARGLGWVPLHHDLVQLWNIFWVINSGGWETSNVSPWLWLKLCHSLYWSDIILMDWVLLFWHEPRLVLNILYLSLSLGLFGGGVNDLIGCRFLYGSCLGLVEGLHILDLWFLWCWPRCFGDLLELRFRFLLWLLLLGWPPIGLSKPYFLSLLHLVLIIGHIGLILIGVDELIPTQVLLLIIIPLLLNHTEILLGIFLLLVKFFLIRHPSLLQF